MGENIYQTLSWGVSWVWDQTSSIWALCSSIYIYTCSHTHISLKTWCISSLLCAGHCTIWNGLVQSIFKMILWSKANLVSILCVCVLVAQLCLTLCDPVDCGSPGDPPGSSAHGILQERILEWVAISFSRGSSLDQGLSPGLPHCRQILYWPNHQRNPIL